MRETRHYENIPDLFKYSVIGMILLFSNDVLLSVWLRDAQHVSSCKYHELTICGCYDMFIRWTKNSVH